MNVGLIVHDHRLVGVWWYQAFQKGNLTNYQVNNGFATCLSWMCPRRTMLSVNLGAYVFEDVDVKFGLDFANDFDAGP